MADPTIIDAPDAAAATAPDTRPLAPASIDQVPVLGYRNYWYPALQSRELKRRPVRRKMLGDDIVFFRNPDTGAPHAMDDRCPHRNSSLALGESHYPGTLSCAYHGWTFDTEGVLVAVLSEGPDCPLVGKVRQRIYPATEFREFVWVWMGEGEPVPLEEDLPPEINDPGTALFTDIQVWKANWRPVTENTDGYHAPVLHVASMPRTLFMSWVSWRKTAFAESGDGLGLMHVEIDSADEAEFPDLGPWPRIPAWKRLVKRLLHARTARGRPITLPDGRTGRITEDVHLPGWRRVRVRRHTVFIEWAVPIDEATTRHVLWDAVLDDGSRGVLARARRAARLFLFRHIVYPTYWRWAYNKRYVGQDKRILEDMYGGPERLQANDAGIIAWRKLSARARKSGAG